LSDSTNSESPGFTPSEQVVGEAFDRVFRQAEGRIIVGTFASLISRIQQVVNRAQAYHRKVAVTGRTMVENISIAAQLGYLNIPPGVMISLQESQHLPPEQVVVLATGTQGEPSAALARMANQRHRQIQVSGGDTVIMSAQIIPGNEEMVHRTINRLYQCGARVVYDRIAPVHVSGHASQEEQKLLLNLIRPQFLIPIHGELRHLAAHARLAYELGMPEQRVLVVENGYVLEFSENGASVGERIPGGYVFVDGTGVGDVGPKLLRERDQLASDGFVVVIVPVTRAHHLGAPPEIISRGFTFGLDAQDLIAKISERTMHVLDRFPTLAQEDELEQQLRAELQQYIYQATHRRPMVIPVLMRSYFS
jgi:ribonuclease J